MRQRYEWNPKTESIKDEANDGINVVEMINEFIFLTVEVEWSI